MKTPDARRSSNIQWGGSYVDKYDGLSRRMGMTKVKLGQAIIDRLEQMGDDEIRRFLDGGQPGPKFSSIDPNGAPVIAAAHVLFHRLVDNEPERAEKLSWMILHEYEKTDKVGG